MQSVTQRQYCLLDFFYPEKKGVKRFFRMPPLYCRYGISVYTLENVNYPSELWNQFGLTPLERTYQLVLTFKESIDIDTKEDFEMATLFLEKDDDVQIKLKEVQLNENWIFICPESFNKIEKISSKFEEKLKDTSYPLLVLKKNPIPVFFLKILDGQARNYINSNEAYKRMINEKVKRTQNMQYFSKQYRHSELFRFIRISSNSRIGRFSNTDNLGCLYKAGYDSDDSFIPWNRVILEKDLLIDL